MEKEYFFDNIDDLIAYLYTKVDNLSPLKLQKVCIFYMLIMLQCMAQNMKEMKKVK